MILEDRLFSFSPFTLYSVFPFQLGAEVGGDIVLYNLVQNETFIFSFTTKIHFSNSSSTLFNFR